VGSVPLLAGGAFVRNQNLFDERLNRVEGRTRSDYLLSLRRHCIIDSLPHLATVHTELTGNALYGAHAKLIFSAYLLI
jgi:hypothetical protein